MGVEEAELGGGFFKFTKPYTWQGWLSWAAVVVFMILGLFQQPQGYIISVFLLVFLAVLSPTSLEAELYRRRKASPLPEDLEAQALISGASVSDWFYGRRSCVPTNDKNSWVFPAPGPKSWFMHRPYHPDPSDELLPEHPAKIGTPMPATISSYGLFLLMFLCGMFALGGLGITASKNSATTSDDTMLYLPYITIAVGVIWLGLGYRAQRHQTAMIDTATSLVRYVSPGPTEVVGQVRPTFSGGIDVLVDGHPNRMVPGCVSYIWTYEVLVRERKVTTHNGRKRVRTEEVWHTIREKNGSVPFILHDGSGGLYTRPSTFKNQDWGGFAKSWETSNQNALGDAYWRMGRARLHQRGDVVRHKWTIHALRIGDPVYALGVAEIRPDDELNLPGINDLSEIGSPAAWSLDESKKSLPQKRSEVDYKYPVNNARFHLIGTDTPRMPAMIKRGTELSNIGRFRSRTELLFIPFATALSGVFLILFL